MGMDWMKNSSGAKNNDIVEQQILYPTRLLMLFSIGVCKIEDKYVVFVKPKNKYAPTMINQPEMYAFIHITHENPFSRLKDQQLKGYLNMRYDMEDHLTIIDVDYV